MICTCQSQNLAEKKKNMMENFKSNLVLRNPCNPVHASLQWTVLVVFFVTIWCNCSAVQNRVIWNALQQYLGDQILVQILSSSMTSVLYSEHKALYPHIILFLGSIISPIPCSVHFSELHHCWWYLVQCCATSLVQLFAVYFSTLKCSSVP